MSVFTFTLNIKQLENYLGDSYRGFETKDYELVTALILARLAYLKTREAHEIGFEVKPDTGKKFPLKPTQAEVNEIILNCREENTSYDFFIIPETELNSDSNKNRNIGRATGNAFQVKKFDKVVDGDFTDELSKYLLKDIPEKYPKTTATLYLF